MKNHTWSTKPKGGISTEFTVAMPTDVDDVELIEARFGSIDRVFVAATRQWTVDVAPGLRELLPDVEAANAYKEAFIADGQKQRTTVRVDADEADEQGFTEEQMAFLRSKGVRS